MSQASQATFHESWSSHTDFPNLPSLNTEPFLPLLAIAITKYSPLSN